MQLPRLNKHRLATHEEITDFILTSMVDFFTYLEIRIKVLPNGRGNLNVSPKEPPRPV